MGLPTMDRRRFVSLPAALAATSLAPRRTHAQVEVEGRLYDAYIDAAVKPHQYEHYTCEFDAAWVCLMTFGYDVTLQDQLDVIGHDTSVEPYYVEDANGVVIYGGQVTRYFSGNYYDNFLARTTGKAMRRVFRHYGLTARPVQNRESIEKNLLEGRLIWIKTTVDFLDWIPATWVMPDGQSYQTVLGNDHAVVVMGFNEDVVVIRDVLGPTSSNWNRVYEYEVDWQTFAWAWGAHGWDGLAVGPSPQSA